MTVAQNLELAWKLGNDLQQDHIAATQSLQSMNFNVDPWRWWRI